MNMRGCKMEVHDEDVPEYGGRDFSLEARMFKAFCDESRLEILFLLRSGEKCACNLLEQLNISQPTLSHHMKILCDSGVISCRKEGKWTHYTIDAEGMRKALLFLTKISETDESYVRSACIIRR